MKKVQKKDKIMISIIILSFVLLILLIISFCLGSDEKDTDDSNVNVGSYDVNDNEEIIKKLKSMKERERMEFYCNTFFNCIESTDYETAYGFLNDSFKNNYFPTCDDFVTYCEDNFNDMMDISQDNIERNGELYVLWITISDAINDEKGEGKEKNIVVKENDFYDFEISFTV